MDWTPNVLRNRGVEIKVNRLGEDGLPVILADGNAEIETRVVRFDNNLLADIEEAFDGFEAPDDVMESRVPSGPKVAWYGIRAFQVAMQHRPFKTVRKVLALAWEVDEREAGRLMTEGGHIAYAAAIMSAFSIANGMDPTQAAEILTRKIDGRHADAVEALAAATEAIATDTTSSYEAGSPPDSPPSATGD